MTPSPIDTGASLAIPLSPDRMILALLGCAVFVAGGTWMIQNPDGFDRSPGYILMVGWVNVALFGMFFIMGLRQLATLRGPVLILSPEGLRDRRLSPDLIPWSAIERLSVWSNRGTSLLIVTLKPDEEAKLKLSARYRWTRRMNAPFGADGLAIASQSLAIRRDDLLAATKAYFERYGT